MEEKQICQTCGVIHDKVPKNHTASEAEATRTKQHSVLSRFRLEQKNLHGIRKLQVAHHQPYA